MKIYDIRERFPDVFDADNACERGAKLGFSTLGRAHFLIPHTPMYRTQTAVNRVKRTVFCKLSFVKSGNREVLDSLRFVAQRDFERSTPAGPSCPSHSHPLARPSSREHNTFFVCAILSELNYCEF